MNKILQLIINEYQNQKPSAEYMLILNEVCEAEEKFMSSLTKEQKTEYFQFDFIAGKLSTIELDEFARYLFEGFRFIKQI